MYLDLFQSVPNRYINYNSSLFCFDWCLIYLPHQIMIGFWSLLFLMTAMGVVTSRNVSASRNASASMSSYNTPCLLEMDGTNVLQELLNGNAVFINIKMLSFVDDSDSIGMSFYENTTVIDVNHWVVTVGKVGELHLTFPFDFEYLSLGTLTSGVEHISLNVTSIPYCFYEVDDEDKLNIIANTLLQLISDDHLKINVCIEQQLKSDNISGIGVYKFFSQFYTFLQISTYFQCWHSLEDISVEHSNVVTHVFILAFVIVSIIFTLFSNLFLISFFCHVKPMNKNGKEYLSLRTNLPMGPKYWLFYSGSQYKCILVSRWLLLIILGSLLKYIPYFIACVSDHDHFRHRQRAMLDILELKRKFWIVNGITEVIFVFMSLVMAISWFKYKILFKADINSYMKSYIVLKHFRVSKSIIPKHHNSGTFVFVMKKKATIAISICHWKLGWEKFYDFIHYLVRLFFYSKSVFLQVPLKIMFVVPFFCVFIFLTCINSIPTFNFWLKYFKKSNLGIKIVLMVVIPIILYAYTIKLASTFTYFALILCYFFIGLLVNPGTSGIIAAAAIIVIGYIISTITDYYHGYVVLLQKIVSVFKELIDDSIVRVSGDKLPPFQQDDRNNDYASLPNDDPQDCRNDNEIAGTSTDISLHNIDEIPQPAGNQIASTSAAASLQPTGNQLAGTSAEASSQPAGETPISTPYEIRQDTEGLICVEKTLFNSIVQKYRPTEIQIMTIIIKIIIICLLLWVAISTLLFLEDFSKLNKQVKLLAAIFIAGIIHLFRKTMWNKAEKESKEKVLLKCIRSYIVEDYLDATLKSVGSNLNSPEGNELEQTTTV